MSSVFGRNRPSYLVPTGAIMSPAYLETAQLSLSVRPERKANSLGGITPATRIATSSFPLALSGGLGYSMGSMGSLNNCADDKATMQNLNDRLAAYLDKVRSLETANAQLEKKIRGWYEKRAPVARDYSGYERTIAQLRNQLSSMSQGNAKLILQIDNARLASDDFRVKYEAELTMRQSVEADMGGLRRVLDDLTLTRSGLETQVESLKEELIYMKKNHDEEMTGLRSRLGGQVNVEVDAAPQPDMSEMIAQIRAQYEGIAEKNRRDMENWYKSKFDALSKQVTVSTEALQSSKSEIAELKRTIQVLEIELQSLLSLKSALESTLQETDQRFRGELQRLQGSVHLLEEELTQVRGDIARQGDEYQRLLDIKSRLELEISVYRRLLDGEDTRTVNRDVEESLLSTRKVKMIVEEVVGGKVVSSRVQEVNPRF
ncbi:keratin, type I cytoskeletal 42 [Amia ocellicauda]|uniref:keratin, type I cytoskeletal 42 n=1 Tax=Amia ocellicauda TaxID=2972642 RepID=UPI003464CBBA